MKSLPEALRALPQVAPQQSAWPALAEQLQRERAVAAPARRPWRRIVPAALAAAVGLIAVAAVLLHQRGRDPAPVVATVAPAAASSPANAANDANATSTHAADAAAQLASLQQRSQALERWLRETDRAAVPLPGPDLAAAAELEDMIAIVDGQLGAAAGDSELPLWRRRVALLEDLSALRYANYKIAEDGIALR